MSNAALRIDRARWWALSNQPFYGALAMSLPDNLTPTPGVDTAATDGAQILWNEGYVGTLDDEEIRYVLLHETLHNAHLHPWRLPADDRGNAAGDHAINLLLNRIPGIRMPKGGLADPQYEGMAEEDILAVLPEPEPDNGSGPGSGSDPCGSFTAPAAGDGDGDSGQDPQAAAQQSQQLREQWESRVIQAAQAQQALGVGELPGDLERILERIRHRAVDWRREMADFVRDAASTRNDWSRAARRHAWQPVIYPRKRADEVGLVIFARDTSGSVDDRTAAEYSALITDCLSETGCTGIVFDCDASIRAEYVLDGYTDCPLTAKGGGGTDFRPVFNRADEMVAAGEHVAGVVYLTDMQHGGRIPDSSEIPTLWLATRDGSAPFGRTVRIGG